MADIIDSGQIVTIMLLVVALEIVALVAWRMVTGRGLRIPAVLLNIGAGGSLMVALKLKFAGASWQWLALSLIAALCFHVADLAWRWRHETAPSTHDR
ncbi:MAG: hypothetical protein AAAFM81_01895 [Pseudomonadota bacterium]